MSNRNLVEACLSTVAMFAAGEASLAQLRQVVEQAVAGLEHLPQQTAEEFRRLLRRLEVEESYDEEGCETELTPALDQFCVLLRRVPLSAEAV